MDTNIEQKWCDKCKAYHPLENGKLSCPKKRLVKYCGKCNKVLKQPKGICLKHGSAYIEYREETE